VEAHLATLWESFADAIGDREALVCGESRCTWQAYDDRAARLASAFAAAGLKTDSKVGLYPQAISGLGCRYQSKKRAM
jgi:non-ribosomal peptide synthetase component E (peptide arylation enzyme)